MRAFLIACMVAGLVPLLTGSRESAAGARQLATWPSEYASAAWREAALEPREAAFFASFPGAIARRTDGVRSVLLRSVSEPTRRLHSAQECYRGLGFEVRELPLQRGAAGLWGAFVATRGADRLLVRERIRDARGGEWTDVSAWFWSALLGRSEGPWLAETVAQPLEPAGGSFAEER